MEQKMIINIGRQLGSGGREIGEKLAARMGITFYDKELITLASQESGLCRKFFEKADERPAQGFVGGMLGMRFPFMGEVPTQNVLSNDALFKVQSDVIRRLAADHSCLFVGRCADYILREMPRCLNIFISAARADRISRISEQYNITIEEATRRIDKTDKTRAEYYNYYSNNTWGAAATYHLCIDSSVLGVDSTVDFLEEFIKRKLG
jgi:cytidylate kinase